MNVERVQLLLENSLVDMGYEEGCWKYEDVILSLDDRGTVSLGARWTDVCKVRLTFERCRLGDTLVLGDAWERGYADLEWKKPDASRKMPWYFFAYDGSVTHCCGVKTQPNALCYWLFDGMEISVTLDLRSGTNPLQLRGRKMEVCTLVFARMEEELQAACAAFCRMLCDNPRIVARPVFGGNDWYCNYGDNSYEKIAEHARRVVECSANCAWKPYMVIDDGWQVCARCTGPWYTGNQLFGDMGVLARQIEEIGAIPGIWIRPLRTVEMLPKEWVLTKQDNYAFLMDPSIPEVLDKVAEDITRIRNWGYKLIKHDFTTGDTFGLWGFEMSNDYVSQKEFADKTKTTAEIIKQLYQTIRDAAGDDVAIIGCNTISHLSAGFFEIQRTGDDTSGKEWERTKKYGINTLAFRMPQHNAFYAADADCVGITRELDWNINRRWLDVLAKSGTPLFISIGDDAYTDEVKADITAAFKMAVSNDVVSRPVDWMENMIPQVWDSAFGRDTYQW